MPTEIEKKESVGARPTENEHVYAYPVEKCEYCKQEVVQRKSIIWGGRNGCGNKTKCSHCECSKIIPITKEEAATHTPLVNNDS